MCVYGGNIARLVRHRGMIVLAFILVFLLSEVDYTAGVKSPERPVVPNVTAISSTEIRITWCRVHSNKVEIDHYELFIDTELEYSGMDVMYIAKRLKPWSGYEVKLRACGVSPGSCSPFSRPALVMTLRDGDNTTTVIQSGVTIFKVIVVPTYTFILGMIAGVLAISLVLIWRYLQSVDLSGESAFELPQFQTEATKDEYDAILKHQPPGNHLWCSGESTSHLAKASNVDSVESHYLEIPPNEETARQQNCLVITDLILPSFYSINSTCESDRLPPKEQQSFHVSREQLDATCEEYTQIGKLEGEASPLNDSNRSENKQELQNGIDKDHVQFHDRTASLTYCTLSDNTLTTPALHTYKEQTLECLDASEGAQHSTSTSEAQYSDKEVPKDSKTHSLFGMVVAIDNSNIYIGAQECASMVNTADRKRHVRVKLQNLVRILEKERTKTRGFAGGSSPPATEHVWEVYRRLGYIVDLEERRGKDEQRVDESLHLWIYKALCELPPGVLVLATGDGMKGKSECDTSFPGCAMKALEKGWTVEVFSWRHSLSSEWIKLTKKHPDALTINYLDKYINYITFVEGRNGRKCSPLPSEVKSVESGP